MLDVEAMLRTGEPQQRMYKGKAALHGWWSGGRRDVNDGQGQNIERAT